MQRQKRPLQVRGAGGACPSGQPCGGWLGGCHASGRTGTVLRLAEAFPEPFAPPQRPAGRSHATRPSSAAGGPPRALFLKIRAPKNPILCPSSKPP
jgi:hypothetical protein